MEIGSDSSGDEKPVASDVKIHVDKVAWETKSGNSTYSCLIPWILQVKDVESSGVEKNAEPSTVGTFKEWAVSPYKYLVIATCIGMCGGPSSVDAGGFLLTLPWQR